jgi:hypothetical protein
MTELKTLKDLTIDLSRNLGVNKPDIDFQVIKIKELKAEAVKWVKEDEGLRKDNTIWRLNGDELLDLITERWMKRLNITEADLQEKKE